MWGIRLFLFIYYIKISLFTINDDPIKKKKKKINSFITSTFLLLLLLLLHLLLLLLLLLLFCSWKFLLIFNYIYLFNLGII